MSGEIFGYMYIGFLCLIYIFIFLMIIDERIPLNIYDFFDKLFHSKNKGE